MKNIKWIMFDLDNTLVDFSIASKKAFFKTFEQLNLECTNETYSVYSEINHTCWVKFEDGLMTAQEIRKFRFEKTFEKLNIEGLDALKVNAQYLNHLVQFTEVYEGVIPMLGRLKNNFKLSIITNGLKEVQRPRLNRLDMTQFFDSIIVSDEIGHSKPSKEYFEFAYNSIKHSIPKNQVLVVGDNLKSDILGGINFGFKTCWVSGGKINETDIKPDLALVQAIELEKILA